MNSPGECGIALRLAVALFSCLAAFAGLANAQADSTLKIVVLRGEGSINNVADVSAQQLVVQVRDENDEPAPNASVTFYLPERGPGGAFFGVYNKLTVAANEQGNAAAASFQPNLIEGRFQIRVIATLGSRTGDATINQTNVLRANAAPTVAPTETASPGIIAKLKSIKLSSRTKKIAAITAGAIIVLVVATRGGSDTSTVAPTVPGTTVIPGTISVGTPR
jgi:hypothetical protein